MGRCFIHPPLIFATQSLIMSLEHITLLVCLTKVCEGNVMKDPLLIVILQSWSIKTLILGILRYQQINFYIAYF